MANFIPLVRYWTSSVCFVFVPIKHGRHLQVRSRNSSLTCVPCGNSYAMLRSFTSARYKLERLGTDGSTLETGTDGARWALPVAMHTCSHGRHRRQLGARARWSRRLLVNDRHSRRCSCTVPSRVRAARSVSPPLFRHRYLSLQASNFIPGNFGAPYFYVFACDLFSWQLFLVFWTFSKCKHELCFEQFFCVIANVAGVITNCVPIIAVVDQLWYTQTQQYKHDYTGHCDHRFGDGGIGFDNIVLLGWRFSRINGACGSNGWNTNTSNTGMRIKQF